MDDKLKKALADSLMEMYKKGVQDGLCAINLALGEAMEIVLPEYKPGLELALQMFQASLTDPSFFEDVPGEIEEDISQKIHAL
jgi:hypothetical protein